jgi:phosphoribosyl-ATP pyrophosphohydrolase
MFDLTELENIIGRRAKDSVKQSYTASLLAKGTNKCAEKFGEEAIEAVIAAATQNRDELTSETADVLFHLLVLLKSANIPLSEVMAELQHRTAQSGHAEKASR